MNFINKLLTRKVFVHNLFINLFVIISKKSIIVDIK